MKNGETIQIRDFYGANHSRYVAQDGGRFLFVSHSSDPRNGFMLIGWAEVLRDLIALTVPAAMNDRVMTAESTIAGAWTSARLVYPLSAGVLAALLGEDPAQVRDQLADLTAGGMMTSDAS